MSKQYFLIIGLVLIISGVGVIAIVMSGIIPNSQNYSEIDWWDSYNPILSAVQFQPEEYILFEGVFDSGEKVHLDMKLSRPRNLGMLSNSDMGIHQRYNIEISVEDSQNNIIKDVKYDTQSLIALAPNSGMDANVDVFFQIPYYDNYKIIILYETWYEQRPFFSNDVWQFYDNGNSEIDAYLTANVIVQKTTPNLVFVISGFVLVVAGIILAIGSTRKQTVLPR